VGQGYTNRLSIYIPHGWALGRRNKGRHLAIGLWTKCCDDGTTALCRESVFYIIWLI